MEFKTLSELCDIVSGGTPSRSRMEFWNNGDIPWIKIGNLNGKYVEKADEYITKVGLENSAAKVLPKGTILYTMFATLGETAILSIDACTNQAIAGICIKDNLQVSTDYIYYFLKSKKKFVNNIGRGVAQNNINMSILKAFKVPLPEYSVQSEIVDILDKTVNIINMRQAELEKLDRLVKARFVEIFEAIKETCNVDYYIKELIAGKSLASEVECKNKVLKTGAVSFDYFDESQIKNLPLNYEPKEEHLVHKGDIIISRMNTAELTGAAAYVWKVSDNVYVPDRLWKAVIRDGVNAIFLWNMLIQPSTKEQIQKVCSGTSGSMKNISKSGMLGIRVKKVDVYLQNKFATFVEEVNKSKVEVKKALDEAQLLFDSLMQKYFG